VGESVGTATVEFLRWLACRPRTYRETMDAWQTSCPRFSVWEDSLIDGLIRLEHARRLDERIVSLTASGRAILDCER
jgi:hypothetical protein